MGRIYGRRCLNIFNPRSGGMDSGSSAPALLPTWECLFQEPTQDNIAVDGTPYYFPLNDAAPNVSVQNSLGTKTLTKVGAGTLTAITDFTFNNSSKGVNFDGVNYLSGDILDAKLGVQDLYAEFDASILNSTGAGCGI